VASFIPSYNAANVLTGPAKMFTQVYNPSIPPAVPADTATLGALWPAPWTPIGATETGLAFDFKRTVDNIMIDEQVTPVDSRTKSLAFTLVVDLSEDTISTMMLAYGGGGITTIPAASGQAGVQILQVATDLTYFSFGFEGLNAFGRARRVMVPISVSNGNAKTTYQRAKKQRAYQTSFESLVAPEQVVIRDITADALP
jgi:hypothetical protein